VKTETELLLGCPGLVGDLARAIDAGLPFSEPQISLGTAFAVMGALKSGHFACGTIHPHSYHGIVARAGLGKTQAQEIAARICEAAEQPELITGDSTSEAGLMNALIVSPRRLIIMDEFGRAFEQMGDDKGGHRQEMLSVLLKLFSCANSVYIGKNYASKDPLVIPRPMVSLLGGSTPHAFFAGMTPRLAHDGMLSRFFLWFASGKSDQIQTKPFDLPNKTLLELARIKDAGTPAGNISTEMVPKQITFEDQESFDAFCVRFAKDARGKANDLESALFARYREQFAKMCIALSDSTGLVSERALFYADELLEFLYAQTLEACVKSLGNGARDLADEAYGEQIYNYIVAECEKTADNRIPSRQVSRAFRKIKLRKMAIEELIEQDRLFVTKAGKNLKLYSVTPTEEDFQDRISDFSSLDPSDPATYSDVPNVPQMSTRKPLK
jgi:hypothetical protein